MPAATQNRKTDVVKDFRRVVIKVPLNVGYLIDLLSNYRAITKADLANAIWRAGIAAYCGIGEDEIDDMSAIPLPRGAACPAKMHELVNLLLSDG